MTRPKVLGVLSHVHREVLATWISNLFVVESLVQTYTNNFFCIFVLSLIR